MEGDYSTKPSQPFVLLHLFPVYIFYLIIPLLFYKMTYCDVFTYMTIPATIDWSGVSIHAVVVLHSLSLGRALVECS